MPDNGTRLFKLLNYKMTVSPKSKLIGLSFRNISYFLSILFATDHLVLSIFSMLALAGRQHTLPVMGSTPCP